MPDFIGTDAQALKLIDDAIVRVRYTEQALAVEELKENARFHYQKSIDNC